MDWLTGILNNLVSWLDKYYGEHTGLTNFVALLVAVVAAALSLPGAISAIRPTFFSKRPRERPILILKTADRETLLHQIRTFKVRPGLNQGLRRAMRLDTMMTELTPKPGNGFKMRTNSEGSLLQGAPISDGIFSFFKQSGRMLWILGEPGTGKTNLLLELADELITEAINNPELPIPVVLSLARWTMGEKSRSLEEWMADDLRSIYNIGAEAATSLLKTGGILPLLDGLDEVMGAKRFTCVEEVNSYLNTQDVKQIAICCRLEEFEATLRYPKIGKALRIEKLTEPQLFATLARPELEGVRRALADAPDLLNILRTPLWLSVLSMAASSTLPTKQTSIGIGNLYDRFVGYAISQDIDEVVRPRFADSTHLLSWLCWLAFALKQRGQIQFAIEDLDASWLRHTDNTVCRTSVPDKTNTSAHHAGRPSPSKVGPSMIARLGFALPIGTVAYWIGGLPLGIVAGVIASLRIEGRFESSEELRFQWREVAHRAPISIMYGAVVGIAVGFNAGIASAISVGSLAAVFEVLQAGFRPRAISRSSAPNYRTMRSLRYSSKVLMIGAIFGFGIITSSAYFASASHGESDIPADVLWQCGLFTLFATIILAGEKGGWFVLRHYYLRISLYLRGFAPIAYVAALNEASERLFMIRRGGTYEFMHSTLRDHLAEIHVRNHGSSPSDGQRRRSKVDRNTPSVFNTLSSAATAAR